MTTAVTPIDKMKLWLAEEIWPEIHALMHNDGYFRLWLKAQEAAGAPYGPIGQMVINGYATYQLTAVRRLCDNRKDVISLPKLLNLIRNQYPHRKVSVAALNARLETECEEVTKLATQYVAHNGIPGARNARSWALTDAKIVAAQRAICEVAVIIERDLLAITQRTHLIPVPQFDQLAEIRMIVPLQKIEELRAFWHSHNAAINGWTQVAPLAA